VAIVGNEPTDETGITEYARFIHGLARSRSRSQVSRELSHVVSRRCMAAVTLEKDLHLQRMLLLTSPRNENRQAGSQLICKISGLQEVVSKDDHVHCQVRNEHAGDRTR
jgi:hypothetical protein